MACSPAQMLANQKNAQKSTGPRTTQGKAVSRANGYKHGLAGTGVVVPHEDAQEIAQRAETLEAEMAPRNDLARGLVFRIAFLMLKLERSAEHEAKAIAYRMRRAEAKFDDARLAEVEEAYDWLNGQPATSARRLRQSPEGIEKLIATMHDLKADLSRRDRVYWDWRHCDRFHHLMGVRRNEVPYTRSRGLTDAIAGNFEWLGADEGGGLSVGDRQIWAAEQMIAILDNQIRTLHELRANFDTSAIDLDRSEAPTRALFDASQEAILARKYEAATERGLYRAIREFHAAQGLTPQVEPDPNLEDEMGSSWPVANSESDESMKVDPIAIEVAADPVPEVEIAPEPPIQRRPKLDRRANRRR